MNSLLKTIREYAIILLVTLLAVELVSFGVLVWRLAETEDISVAESIAKWIQQHPLLDRPIARYEYGNDDNYFLPTTQYAYYPNRSAHRRLKIGKFGFILNSDEEPTDFPEKPVELTRVVILGGSSAAGVKATGSDKTIAARLEGLLNDRGEGRYQVLNFGMAGNYSYGEVTKLITEVAYLQPDVVIMFDGQNDAHYANLEHLRRELDAPLMNWADFSYHYFDAMTGLRRGVRSPPPIMTYAYLLAESFYGEARTGSVREQRTTLYNSLPAQALSKWVAERDSRYLSVMKTNLDFAAAWAARNDIWYFGYLQPHPWEYKNIGCERAAGTKLAHQGFARRIGEARYVEVMRAAYQGYAQIYRELDNAYAGIQRVRFIDMRQLFEDVTDCVYDDSIHYNDSGNLIIAKQMYEDLKTAGVIGSSRAP